MIMRERSFRALFALVVLVAVIVGTSGCGVLDWLGKHPPPNNPPPPPRPKSMATKTEGDRDPHVNDRPLPLGLTAHLPQDSRSEGRKLGPWPAVTVVPRGTGPDAGAGA
jgi:hypothetical protein